jgi:hypothetical protein
MALLTLVLLPLNPVLWAAVTPPVHLSERHGLNALGQSLGGVGRCLLQRRRVSQESGCTRFAQIGDQMKTVFHLLAKGHAISLSERESLAVLTGVGAVLVARIGGFELAIDAQEVNLNEAKVVQDVPGNIDALIDDIVTDAVAHSRASLSKEAF